MTMQFRSAQRSEAKPLVGIFAESGRGKTYSSLLLARGFVGPTGRIGMIDTESGRGEAFADPVEYPELKGPGATNYDVLPLRDNFSPTTFGEAITAAEKANLDALIIDSASHEWEGAGGVLDMASRNQAAGKKGVLVWQQPKMDHQRHFMLRLMQTPIPLVIVCMRAKYPMVEVQKPGGGKDWARSPDLEPKQSDDILSEMFVHGWIDAQHKFHLVKSTTRSISQAIVTGQPITVETGRRLAEWARRKSAELGAAPAQSTATPPATPGEPTKRTPRAIIDEIKAATDIPALDAILARANEALQRLHLQKPETYDAIMDAANVRRDDFRG